MHHKKQQSLLWNHVRQKRSESPRELHENVRQSINQKFSTRKCLKERSLHECMLTYCNLKWDCGLSVGWRFVQQSLALRVFPIEDQTHGAGVSPALTQSWGQP